MLTTARTTFAALTLASAIVVATPLTAAAPTGKPEEVGLSSERLKRVAELVQRLRDFENMVMQAVVGSSAIRSGGTN